MKSYEDHLINSEKIYMGLCGASTLAYGYLACLEKSLHNAAPDVVVSLLFAGAAYLSFREIQTIKLRANFN